MNSAPKNFAELVGDFIGILALMVPLVFALTLVVIIWKIIDTWVINAGDVNQVEEGKKFVVTGVIVLVIMSGIWGILALLRTSLFGLY